MATAADARAVARWPSAPLVLSGRTETREREGGGLVLDVANPLRAMRVHGEALGGDALAILAPEGRRGGDTLPLLADHVRSVAGTLGRLDFVCVDEDGAMCWRAVFDRNDPTARTAHRKAAKGYATGFSYSYMAYAYVEVAAGTTLTILGREYAASEGESLWVATEWTPSEGSLTPCPRNPLARFGAAILTTADLLPEGAAVEVRDLDEDMLADLARQKREREAGEAREQYRRLERDHHRIGELEDTVRELRDTVERQAIALNDTMRALRELREGKA